LGVTTAFNCELKRGETAGNVFIYPIKEVF
jgi:hypothetical protein